METNRKWQKHKHNYKNLKHYNKRKYKHLFKWFIKTMFEKPLYRSSYYARLKVISKHNSNNVKGKTQISLSPKMH